MNISLLVINAFLYDTRVQKEAKTLVEAGYQVKVFALHGPGLAEKEIRDGYTVEWIRIRSRGWGTHIIIRMLKYLEFNARAIWRLARSRPHVIHAHDVNALVPAYVAARLARARLIYDAHELWAERRATLLRSDTLRCLIRSIEGRLARSADAVITVNQSIAQYLAREYQLPETPVVLMHSQEYREIERSNILREEFNLPESVRIVIYPGALLPGRGLETLIQTAHLLENCALVIMGKGHIRPQIQQLIEAQDFVGQVILRDPVPPEDVLHYVASADVGVIPTPDTDLSYFYSAGNKLFHYIMAGIPAAVSNQPEKRRIVETYGVGTVFDQTSPEDMARVINGILADSQAYRTMCQNANRAARELLNWGVESTKLLALYQRMQSPTLKESP